MDSATWYPTPAAASAARRLRPEVSKNSSTALSSNEGELARSITTCVPAMASLRPSPVMLLTPVLGEAATTSWSRWRRIEAVFDPIRPVPPMMTIFIPNLLLISSWPGPSLRDERILGAYRHLLLLFRMRRAEVWELLQNVGVGLEAGGGTLIFRQEADAILDYVVSEAAAVWVLGGFRRIETQHVGKCTLPVDRGDCFLARVVPRMAHQMHELLEPSLTVVDRLARVVFLLGVVGVEEAADAGMPRAVDVKQLAVAPHTASSPDVDLALGIELARRELDRGRKYVRFGIRIHAGPWRLAAEMRLGEIALAPGIEQVLDPVEVEKERVAAAAGEERIRARLDDIRRRTKGHFAIGDDLRPDRFGRT